MAVLQTRAVVAAYRELVAGRSRPLVELLHPDVEWRDERPSARALHGRDEVGALVAAAAACGRRVELIGIAIRRGLVEVEFAAPWWDGPSRLTRVAARLLSASFVQTVQFDESIRRIDNRLDFTLRTVLERDTYVASLAPRLQDDDARRSAAVAKAACKRQMGNEGVTELVEMPGRRHGLVIDNGWRDVADTALAFVRRFV